MKTSRLPGFFWGSAVFLFFKNYVSRIQWTEKQEEVICRLGSYTFGIYLIHAFSRDILHRQGGQYDDRNYIYCDSDGYDMYFCT